MIPTFAVVGHPNKGKSSIVATLSENSQIQISPVPGTTRTADHYALTIEGQALYDLVDTPGFQRAGQLHNWLKSRSGDASARPELVRQFVEEHAGQEKYGDECALLEPILAGAGIIYVVDGSKPYGAEYELEMDILRWTGQPRMALINMIGQADYRESWRAGLDQYFSIVREFNAHQASFEQRLGLLRAFGELEESWREPLLRACEALSNERKRQLEQTSTTIAELLQTAIGARVERPLGPDETSEDLTHTLTDRLHKLVRTTETRAQKEVQRIYRHQNSDVKGGELDLVTADLFAQQNWQLFGLSRFQLMTTGAASGALAGGTVDLFLGGTSLLLGTIIGGAIGSVSAWLGGPELAKIKVLGSTLGGETATVGPIRDPNFPWVLLGRACLHHALISERNHAVRSRVIADLDGDDHFFAFLDHNRRAELERVFGQIRKGDVDAVRKLQPLVLSVLQSYQV